MNIVFNIRMLYVNICACYFYLVLAPPLRLQYFIITANTRKRLLLNLCELHSALRKMIHVSLWEGNFRFYPKSQRGDHFGKGSPNLIPLSNRFQIEYDCLNQVI